MRELRGNLFNPVTYSEPQDDGWNKLASFQPDAICITTNGFVKKNGEAVMGRGCARTAAQLMPGLPEALGNALKSQGLQVYAHGPWNGIEIVTFPVKPVSMICGPYLDNVVKHMRKQFKPGDRAPGWACVADHNIIKRSASQLVTMTNERGWERVVLPRPGAGAGQLDWGTVRANLSQWLDDRFYIITF